MPRGRNRVRNAGVSFSFCCFHWKAGNLPGFFFFFFPGKKKKEKKKLMRNMWKEDSRETEQQRKRRWASTAMGANKGTPASKGLPRGTKAQL